MELSLTNVTPVHGGRQPWRGLVLRYTIQEVLEHAKKAVQKSTGRDTDQRLRTISGQTSSTFGGNRWPESHGRCQHRGRFQEIGISEGPPAQVPNTSSEVQRSQALVAQLQSRRFRPFLCRGDAAVGVGPSTRFSGSNHGRQAGGGGEDLPVDHPRRPRVARSSSRTNHGRVRCLYVACHGRTHGSMISQLGDALLPQLDVDICAWRDAVKGLRGVRVGEASHPGPRRRRRERSLSVESSWSVPDRTLLDDFERDLFASGLERAHRG